ALIGGNIAHAPPSFTVEVIGVLEGGVGPLLRAGGRAGDDVYVTGTLGDAAGGLELLGRMGGDPGPMLDGAPSIADGRRSGGTLGSGEAAADQGEADAAQRVLIERFLRPLPRIDAGLALVG